MTSHNRNPEHVSNGYIDYYELENVTHYRQLLEQNTIAAQTRLCFRNIRSAKCPTFPEKFVASCMDIYEKKSSRLFVYFKNAEVHMTTLQITGKYSSLLLS
jgi:hypothetical protein